MPSEKWLRGWKDASHIDQPWYGNFRPDEEFDMDDQEYLTGFAARRVLQPRQTVEEE